jgi:large subunit ribosomal protein L17
MLGGLAADLFTHEQLRTTVAKAKALRPVAERLITFAKRGDLASRRRVMTVVRDKSVVHELFTEIAPVMAERNGGYTRITKIGNRKGDNAPMAVIELVLEPLTAKQATVREAEAATKRAAKKAPATKAAPGPEPAEEPAEEPVDEPVEEAASEAADVEEGPYGPDSRPPTDDGEPPEGFYIKGNRDSMKFHTPASPWYEQTVAEVWFKTGEAAEAAGFVEAGKPKDGEAAEG